MTVRGRVRGADLGRMLPHEHLFSNFGEDPQDPAAYDESRLIDTVIPYVESVKRLGCRTIVDATAQYFGRAPRLLRSISERTDVHILTNSGYYGAAKDRYVPKHAFTESSADIALRWIREFEEGIGGSGVRPGFLKIGVDPGGLSDIDAKLVRAAARTHARTGLTIAVHTGDNATGASAQLDLLADEGVAPKAWIWVHANQCNDTAALQEAARRGAWLSFDGLDSETIDCHLECVRRVKEWGRLKQVLLSHDGNSFRAGGRQPMRRYSALYTDFAPLLSRNGFSDSELVQLLVANPARCFALSRRTLRRGA
jgi:predicted metal-dependent phosphotriesterase family hydrolase